MHETLPGHLLYTRLAEWWPLLSSPADYAEEAAFYSRTLREHALPEAKSLLELGSGGGNNASHMKADFEEVALVDLSSDMLAVSKRLNPDCEHVVGDMRSVRLGRQFDCVFVHDAICYATTSDDLRAVVATARTHCRPGGSILFAPDFIRETFAAGTDHGGHDLDGRGLRYLEWTWDPDPADTSYAVDYAFMLRDEDGSVKVHHERHVEGLFAESIWLAVIAEEGFEPRAIQWNHSDGPESHTVFVARRARL